jgi:hypothetical protein
MSSSYQTGENITELPTPDDLHLRYLVSEIARLDVILHREVRRWRLAGQNPGDQLRGLYISNDYADALLARPFASGWGQSVRLDAQEDARFEVEYAQAVSLSADILNRAVELGLPTPRLAWLSQAYQFSPFEQDLLLLCCLPEFDPRYESLFGFLQDDVTRKQPTFQLALNLFAQAGLERLPLRRYLDDRATLFHYGFLTRQAEGDGGSLLSAPLRADEGLLTWLAGVYHPSGVLSGAASLEQIDDRPEDELFASLCTPILDAQRLDGKRVVLYGADRLAQVACARRIAKARGQPLLTLFLERVPQEVQIQALRTALRDARLNQAVPLITGWDLLAGERQAPPAQAIAELADFPGVALIACQALWQVRGASPEQHFIWVECPLPDFVQRREIWRHFLSGSHANLDLERVAAQFHLSCEQIRDACNAARSEAAFQQSEITSAGLLGAARRYSNPNLSKLASKIEPHFDWKDIVLPADQIALLRELVATVRSQPVVLESWKVGRKLVASSGITVLFAGPPGTGKTMAAEVIANELGLDLYKIDLSMVVSKYIGETEKNLEQIFREAETSNAILFFDEADALFGKRSEVRDSHDRYANIEISYLLQRMEAYSGVAILATNLRANLDEAFTRRLQFVVDFPFPDEDDRLRIWKALFLPTIPVEGPIDLTRMAREFKIAGGNIRNIIVNAAYLAAADGGVVRMNHILHSTRREMQKLGRLTSDSNFGGPPLEDEPPL